MLASFIQLMSCVMVSELPDLPPFPSPTDDNEDDYALSTVMSVHSKNLSREPKHFVSRMLTSGKRP